METKRKRKTMLQKWIQKLVPFHFRKQMGHALKSINTFIINFHQKRECWIANLTTKLPHHHLSRPQLAQMTKMTHPPRRPTWWDGRPRNKAKLPANQKGIQQRKGDKKNNDLELQAQSIWAWTYPDKPERHNQHGEVPLASHINQFLHAKLKQSSHTLGESRKKLKIIDYWNERTPIMIGERASPRKWIPNTLNAMDIGRYCTGTILKIRHEGITWPDLNDMYWTTESTYHMRTEFTGENVEKMRNSATAVQTKKRYWLKKTKPRQQTGQLCMNTKWIKQTQNSVIWTKRKRRKKCVWLLNTK